MSSIRAQVEELGSWITGFEFEGTRYGGDYFPNDDSRVLRFVDAFRQWLRELPDRRRALRILECGCLEGGHTALLAKAFPEAEIVATDLREENLRKARFLVSLYGLHNVRWLQDDFSSPHTVFCQEYDAHLLCRAALPFARSREFSQANSAADELPLVMDGDLRRS